MLAKVRSCDNKVSVTVKTEQKHAQKFACVALTPFISQMNCKVTPGYPKNLFSSGVLMRHDVSLIMNSETSSCKAVPLIFCFSLMNCSCSWELSWFFWAVCLTRFLCYCFGSLISSMQALMLSWRRVIWLIASAWMMQSVSRHPSHFSFSFVMAFLDRQRRKVITLWRDLSWLQTGVDQHLPSTPCEVSGMESCCWQSFHAKVFHLPHQSP